MRKIDLDREYSWVLETLETYFYDCTFAIYRDDDPGEYVIVIMKANPKLQALLFLQGEYLDEDGAIAYYNLSLMSPIEQKRELNKRIIELEEIGF